MSKCQNSLNMINDSNKKKHTQYTYRAVLSFRPLLLRVHIGPASNDTDRTLHPNGKCHDVGTFWLSSIPNRGAGCMEPVKNVILPPYQLKPVICNKHCVAADTNLLQTYGAYKSGGSCIRVDQVLYSHLKKGCLQLQLKSCWHYI